MLTETEQQSGKITIIGSGPIALTIAALSLQHIETTIVTKSKIIMPIAVSGSVTASIDNNRVSSIMFENFGEHKEGPILLGVKSYDLQNTLKSISSSLNSKTPIILIQNGLSIFLDATEIIGRKIPYVRALLYFGARKDSETSIIVEGKPKAVLAAPDYAEKTLGEIASLFTLIGFDISLHSNVAHAEWEKALVSLSVVPVATVRNESNDIVLREQEAKKEALMLLSEARAIAASEGFIEMPFSDEEILSSVAEYGKNRNSLLLDIERGKNTELEVTLGRALRIAEGNKVNVPTLQKYYRLLKK